MYRTTHNLEILEREIEKTTEANVFYKNVRTGKLEREAKIAHYWQWHETEEQAVLNLKEKCNAKIALAKRQIEMAQSELTKIFEKYHI